MEKRKKGRRKGVREAWGERVTVSEEKRISLIWMGAQMVNAEIKGKDGT